MKIAYKGSFLREGLLERGHQLLEAGASGLTAKNAAPLPDLVLVEMFGPDTDLSFMPDCDAPRAVYCIDSPLNEFWFREIARTFDHVFVDQPQTVSSLAGHGLKAAWLPLPVQRSWFQPDVKKEHDITFVGTMNQHRQKRRNLLKLLGATLTSISDPG